MKEARRQQSIGIHTVIIMVLLILVYAFYLTGGESEYPESCNVTLNEGYINLSIDINLETNLNTTNTSTNTYTSWVNGATFNCSNGNYMVLFNRGAPMTEPGFYHKSNDAVAHLIYILSVLFALIFVGFILNYLVSYILIRWPWYAKRIPVKAAGGKNRKKEYLMFKPKDVEGNVVVIPHFSNVELVYKTTGDFSTQLQRIKIREKTWYQWKNGKVGKPKSDILDWHAVFYFKNKPKNGHMEVIWQ